MTRGGSGGQGPFGDADARRMREAIDLARRGEEAVSPNPMVGAVVVRRGRVLGRGWHRRHGGPHAEVEALRDAGSSTGGTIYVSLEPCGHTGKTPPCADAIIAAGLRRVVYAVADPNPLTRGKGPRRLRSAGVEVASGLLRADAVRLNRPYFHWIRTGRPWVLLKWAMTLDGKIATGAGESRWITGAPARSFGHRLRRRVDAVLVGTRTAMADDPLLTPRPARGRHPWRVLLDRRARIPLGLRLLRPAGRERTVYVTSRRCPAARRHRLESRGVRVLVVGERGGGIDLEELLELLGREGISQILVEGGGEVAGTLVRERLVQEVAAFIAPRIVGGAGAPGPVGGEGIARLADSLDLAEVEVESPGGDLLVRGIVRAG